MSKSAAVNLLDQVFDPVTQALTPEAARRLVDWRANTTAQARIGELGDKCSAGKLTSEERDEYELLVSAINLIAVLQAKAREFLARNT